MQREFFSFWHTVQVRWGDMDAYNHVNNAKYFTYFESARIRFFESVELWKHSDGRNEGPALVSATCNFRRQVRYPATLEVGVQLTHIGNRSWTLEMAVFDADSKALVADGISVTAWADYDNDRSATLPESLRVALEGKLNPPSE